MSTFIHGGSALTLDIGAKAHTDLARGDVVMINPLVAGEGYETKDVITNSALGQLAPYGVVLGTDGKSSFASGEDILVRVVGSCPVYFNAGANSVVGEAIKLTAGQKYATPVGNANFTATSSTVRLLGIAHTASGPTTDQLGTCYINGLTMFG